jgi:Mn-containing catalase
MHFRPVKKALEEAEQDPLVAVTGGGGLNLFNSAGNPWTADYLKISGELDVDLRNNIAAEARAKITYERLMHLTDDMGTKEALQFLMTREITHLKAFTAALDSLGTGRFTIGKLPPTPGIVDDYYNDSTGEGPLGKDGVGKWIAKDGLRVLDTPDFIKALGDSVKKGEELARQSSKYSPDPEQMPRTA